MNRCSLVAATTIALLCLALPFQLAAQGVQPMARADFDALFKQVDNAGRWGADDERGTLNLITPAVRRAASAEVRTGATVSLAREMVHGQPEGGFGPISVEVLLVSDSALGPSDGTSLWAGERTTLFYHGWGYTHIDALSHMPAYRGRGYNNAPVTHAPPVGQSRNSIATMRDGVIGRGVLVDLPALRGVDYVAPGGAITARDLEAWEKQSGVRIGAGDIVLVRSGRWSAQALAAKVERSAGIHPTTAAWLHARGVAVLGDESGTDTTPTSVAGINSPLHVLALVAMGMPLIENLDLEELANQAADALRHWPSEHLRAPHHGLALLPDLPRDLVRIPIAEARQEQLDRQRTGVRLRRELLQHDDDRSDTVAGDDPAVVVEQFARHVGHVLEMHMLDLAGADLIHVLELVQSRPEVIEVEHHPHVRVRGLADRLERSEQSGHVRRGAHELDAAPHVERADGLSHVAHVVDNGGVIAFRQFLRA